MKPTNLAQLVRYLTVNPNLECHFTAFKMLGHGNAGTFDIGNANHQVVKRGFVKRTGNELVFTKATGTTRFQFDGVADFTFADAYFEISTGPDTPPVRYYYRDTPMEVDALPVAEAVTRYEALRAA